MTNAFLLSNATPSRTCLADDCLLAVHGKGYCAKHYTRIVRYGDPSAGKYNRGIGSNPIERFWSRVAITADPHRCWNWLGKPKQGGGYGEICINGKRVGTHVFSWSLANGRDPVLFILHSCDNPKCVNPNHLREATHAENMRDMVLRNRHAHGETSYAKLTVAEVTEIKYNMKDVTGRQIAKRFNINASTVSKIQKGKRWAHV